MPLVINSLGADTLTHTHIHIQTIMNRSITKKLGMRWPVHAWFKISKITAKFMSLSTKFTACLYKKK